LLVVVVLAGSETTHPRLHPTVTAVPGAAVGEPLFLVRGLADAKGHPLPPRLWRLRLDGTMRAIRLEHLLFRDPARASVAALGALKGDDVVEARGCAVFLRFYGDHFAGASQPDACPETAGAALEKVRVSKSELWVAADASKARDVTPYRTRKVQYFSGWAQISGAEGAARDRVTSRNLLLHTEGQKQPIRGEDGASTGYSIELAQLSYGRARDAVLKLGIIDDKTGETVAYVWAKPDADRIGLNLGWVQVGLTKTDAPVGQN
jgi:hypothetical protein